MNAETVQEIANQLGIGVNEVMAYLPGYASGKIISCITTISIAAFLIIVLLIPFLICLKKANNKDLSWDKRDDYELTAIIIGVIDCFALLIGLVIIILSINDLIMWMNAPELTFLKSLISD